MGVCISSLEGRIGILDVSISKRKVWIFTYMVPHLKLWGKWFKLTCEPTLKPPFILLWLIVIQSSKLPDFKTHYCVSNSFYKPTLKETVSTFCFNMETFTCSKLHLYFFKLINVIFRAVLASHQN